MLGRGLLVLAGVAFVTPSPSEACIRGFEDAYDQESNDIGRARRLFSQGHLRRSFRVAGRAISRVRRNPDEDAASARRLESRADLLLASLTIRLDGKVDRRRWRTPREVSKADRTANLLWAIERLESMQGDDPQVTARLGEAYGRLANRQADAVRVLEPLAESDLMPDVHGYAALARSYAAVGDEDGRDMAVRVCRQRASRVQQGICPAFGAA